ncbi:hypothetical protein Ancab_033931 [Ancistrocladus abbreviatus]
MSSAPSLDYSKLMPRQDSFPAIPVLFSLRHSSASFAASSTPAYFVELLGAEFHNSSHGDNSQLCDNHCSASSIEPLDWQSAGSSQGPKFALSSQSYMARVF